MHSANQITRLDNRDIQNKSKRPQSVLDEGGPLKFDWGLTFSNDRVRLGYEIKRRIDEIQYATSFSFFFRPVNIYKL